MLKKEFSEELGKKLKGLPKDEIEERIAFYGEMIDDRMEEGLSEDEAVAGVGDVDDIAKQIVADVPLSKIVKEKIKPKRKMRAWEIVLLVLGSPVWIAILLSLFAVVLSLYIVWWAMVVCFWCCFAVFAAAFFGGIGASVLFICQGHTAAGVFMIGASVLCAGLAIFTFFGCKAATKGALILTKKIAVGIKNALIGKDRKEDKS